ncbi:MAG: hypothetical protein U9O78_02365 [Patescibacteria group bacterium]|nr:hypothetical protein [Patescibacteria group bacterium]
MKTKRIILFYLFLILAAISFWLQGQSALLHDDEYIFVGRSKFFDYYIAADFNNPLWQSFESYDVPKLGEYFYAGYLKLFAGNQSVDHYLEETGFYQSLNSPVFIRYLENLGHQLEKAPGQYNQSFMNLDWAQLLSLLRKKSIKLYELPAKTLEQTQAILIARQAAFILAIFNLVLIFIVADELDQPPLGLIVVTLLTINTNFREIAVRAMGDTPLLTMTLFSFLLSQVVADKLAQDKKVSLAPLAAAGFVIGLGISIKLNLVLSLIHFLTFLIYSSATKQKALNIFKNCSIVTGIAWLSFALLNPFIWSAPLKKSLFMFQHRLNIFKHQQAYAPDLALNSIQERILAVFNGVFGCDFIGLVFAGLTIIGILVILAKVVQRTRNQPFFDKTAPPLFLNFLLFITIVGLPTIIFVPLDWPRYYFLLTVSSSILAGQGLLKIIFFLKNLFERE